MAADDLNPKQARFVAAYLVHLNAKRAAIEAGYSENTAESQGSRLLSNAKVAAAIVAGREKQADRLGLKAEDVLRELMRIGMADIGQAFDDAGRLKPVKDMPLELRRAVASIEVEEVAVDGEALTTVKKLKFWDKNAALTNLAKNLELLTVKVKHSADTSFADALKAARDRAQRG